MNINVREADENELPICPQCGVTLQEIIRKKVSQDVWERYWMYFCPSCKKSLGIAPDVSTYEPWQ